MRCIFGLAWAGALWVAWTASYKSDMSVFLPKHATPEQTVLVDELKEGVGARLLMVAIESDGRVDSATLAALSQKLSARLQGLSSLASVSNGALSLDPKRSAAEQAFVFQNRYRLSPRVNGNFFSVAQLRERLQESLAELASSGGLLTKDLFAQDPTGETLFVANQFTPANTPNLKDGVWMNSAANRTLLLAHTQAAGGDLDAHDRTLAQIQAEFGAINPPAGASLVTSGPPVFAAMSRSAIEGDATRLSVIGSVLIVAMLLWLFRSPRLVLLGIVPVVSGVLAGVAAVALGFGTVHALTLGFGVTLMGEAIDYAIYLFVQRAESNADTAQFLKGYWPTIRLGVMTSVVGFAALLFSGFTGLAQLGVFSIAGLITAALVARFVLPDMLPDLHGRLQRSGVQAVQRSLANAARVLSGRAAWVVGLALVALLLLGVKRAGMWTGELLAISPVPFSAQKVDQRLRGDLAVADGLNLVVVTGRDEQAVLAASERVAAQLTPLIDAGALRGVDYAARFVPSLATQNARCAAIPPTEVLQGRLAAAVQGMPLRASALGAFVESVRASCQSPALTRAALDGTRLAPVVDSLLMRLQDGRWRAMLALHGPGGARIDTGAVRRAVQGATLVDAKALVVDLKAESDALYRSYLSETLWLAGLGLLALIALLTVALKSPSRLFKIVVPLLAAVLCVAAGLRLFDVQLSLLHVVGLLLVVAVGSNYALFFDQANPASKGEGSQVPHLSLIIANLSTAAGFGILAFSSVPVLKAIGLTVCPGTFLALVFSAMMVNKQALSIEEQSAMALRILRRGGGEPPRPGDEA